MDRLYHVPLGALGMWLREAVLCLSCGFIYPLQLRVCPKCSDDSGVNLSGLLDKLAKQGEKGEKR